jgi:two-component system osmolarity sensor histidine kinase EnvZ
MWKRLLPGSLMGRALLIASAPLLVMQVLSAWVFYDAHWDQISKQLARALAGEIAFVVDAFTSAGDPGQHALLFERAARFNQIRVAFDAGAILPNVPQRQTAVEGEVRRALVYHGLTKPFRVEGDDNMVVVAIQFADGVLRFVTPTARLFSRTTHLYVLWTIGTSMLLLGIAALVMRRQVRPILRLARAADAFGKGHDVDGFRPQGAREVRLAGLAFLAMRNRLQRQISQRTAMLAGVSHDLRTPLTRMKLQLEMMRPVRAVGELKDDVAEMEHMLDGYLAFARGEGGERTEVRDVGLLLAEIVRQSGRRGAAVELALEDNLVLPMRPSAMSRCLTNLVENALRYGRTVRIQAARHERAIEVTIDDDGPGIPAAERENVFKPFYRLDGSRNPSTGGVGLGLAIALDVARGHGGNIYLEDSTLGGLRARLRLPL